MKITFVSLIILILGITAGGQEPSTTFWTKLLYIKLRSFCMAKPNISFHSLAGLTSRRRWWTVSSKRRLNPEKRRLLSSPTQPTSMPFCVSRRSALSGRRWSRNSALKRRKGYLNTSLIQENFLPCNFILRLFRNPYPKTITVQMGQ